MGLRCATASWVKLFLYRGRALTGTGASLKSRCRVKPIFLDILYSFDKLLPTTSEWLAAGEAEAGSAGEQPAEE